jgi:endonuclease/exonuclease/phosphatase family metal-dependent hydrolase
MTPRLGRLVLFLAVALALALAGTATAAQTPLGVETRNLYLGSSLDPATSATTAPAFFAGVNQIWSTVKASDPAARMQKIADEIAREKPDLVGLQEVSRWTATPLAAGVNEPSFDFLTLLQSALTARGQSYAVAATSDNFDFTIGLPLSPPLGTPQFLLRFLDRDVILVRNRPGLTWSNPQDANFTAQAVLQTPIGVPLSFNRGWTSIEGVVDGRSFKFVNTHLEVAGQTAPFQVAQAQELLAGPMGPNTKPVIAAGDFNSAADGSTTATYGILTQTFQDAWVKGNRQAPGFTCCQANDLRNKQSLLDERIDLVLARGTQPNPAPKAKVIGDRQADKTPSGLWPSDHAGVSATVYP